MGSFSEYSLTFKYIVIVKVKDASAILILLLSLYHYLFVACLLMQRV